MIYPGKITIWILLLLPFAAMAPHGPTFFNAFALACVILAATAIYDAWGASARINAISVSLPETERMTIYNETTLRFLFANIAHEKIRTRVKPEFSEYIEVNEPE
ncbi:MAG: hypothetical protein KAG97_07420, partial [Victivallales bacterium]|nr:hypothetical protein [Victivallales bacterium]